MTVDNFFEACNEAMDEKASNSTQCIQSMDAFGVVESQAPTGSIDDMFDSFSFDTPDSDNTEINNDLQFDLDLDLDLGSTTTMQSKSGAAKNVNMIDGIPEITIAIKPHASSSSEEAVSITGTLLKYFTSKGVKIYNQINLENVAELFKSVHPAAENYDDPVKCVSYIMWVSYKVPLAEDAIKRLDWKSILNPARLCYTHRTVGYDEIDTLYSCNDGEFEFCNKYSLRADLTADLLNSYREYGEDFIEEIKSHLDSADVLKTFIQFKSVGRDNMQVFNLAQEQGCTEEYLKALNEDDLVTQKIIMDGKWKTCSKYLDAVDKDTCTQYLGYYYFPLILDLMASGFTRKDFYDEYLKEENIVGDFVSKTPNLSFFKLLNNGTDVYTAVLSTVYNRRHLLVDEQKMAQNKDRLKTLALAYMSGDVTDIDVLLHVIFLMRTDSVKLDTSKPMSSALMAELSSRIHFVNLTDTQVSESNATSFQLVFQKSSLVFDMYEFVSFPGSVITLVERFSSMRNSAKVYYPTPEICVISFGDTMTSFINSHRVLHSSLQNWIDDIYATAEVDAEYVCTMNGVLANRTYAKIKDVGITAPLVSQLIEDLYNSKDANKVDLIFDYLNKNPSYLAVLKSDNRVLALKLLGSVLYLEGFSKMYGFLRNFVSVFPSVTLTAKTGAKSMPTSATVVVSFKKRGNKVYSFDSFMNPTVFDTVVLELSNASEVHLYYHNTIHFEVT